LLKKTERRYSYALFLTNLKNQENFMAAAAGPATPRSPRSYAQATLATLEENLSEQGELRNTVQGIQSSLMGAQFFVSTRGAQSNTLQHMRGEVNEVLDTLEMSLATSNDNRQAEIALATAKKALQVLSGTAEGEDSKSNT
jgi:hypothetical protein